MFLLFWVLLVGTMSFVRGQQTTPTDSPVVRLHSSRQNDVVRLSEADPNTVYVQLNSSFILRPKVSNGIRHFHLKFKVDLASLFRTHDLIGLKVNQTVERIKKANISDVGGLLQKISRRQRQVDLRMAEVRRFLGLTDDELPRLSRTLVYQEGTEGARLEELINDALSTIQAYSTSPDDSSADGSAPLPVPKPLKPEPSTEKPESSTAVNDVAGYQLVDNTDEFRKLVSYRSCITQPELFANCSRSGLELYRDYRTNREVVSIGSDRITRWTYPVFLARIDSEDSDEFKAALQLAVSNLKKKVSDLLSAVDVGTFMAQWEEVRDISFALDYECKKIGADRLRWDSFTLFEMSLTSMAKVGTIWSDPKLQGLILDLPRVEQYLKIQLESLKRNLMPAREKRQVLALLAGLGIVGAIGSSLFSVAEVHQLSQEMNALSDNQRILGASVEASHRAINDMNSRLATLANLTSSLAADLQTTTKAAKANDFLNRMDAFLMALDNDCSNLLLTVESILRGSFSTLAMDPDHLSDALTMAERRANADGFSLLTPLTTEVFRAPTSFLVNGVTLEIFVHLDVIKTESLDLFEFLPAFLPVPGSDKVIRIRAPDNKNFLAVSKVSRKGILLSKSEINECALKKGVYICPHMGLLRHDVDQSCLGLLMASNVNMSVIRKKCLVEVHEDRKDRQEVALVGDNRLFVHVFQPTLFTLSCLGRPTTYSHLAPGSFMVFVRPGCRFVTEQVEYQAPSDVTITMPSVIVLHQLDQALVKDFLNVDSAIGSTVMALRKLAGSRPEYLHTLVNLHSVQSQTNWWAYFLVVAILLGLISCVMTTMIMYVCGGCRRIQGYQFCVRRSMEAGDIEMAEMRTVRARRGQGGEEEGKPLRVSD